MKVFGVACFVIGVAALCGLVIRRGRATPMRWPDYAMMFIGIAGAMVGIAAVFTRA